MVSRLDTINYSKYEYSLSSVQEKIDRRETVFKDECKKAYKIGENLVE
jgi:hypothetical protein